MVHNKYKEWIQLAILDELGDDDRRSLEVHLADCAECTVEFEEMKSLVKVIGESRAAGPSDHLFREARRDLADAISRERALAGQPAKSLFKRLTQGVAWSGSRSPVSPSDSSPGWTSWIGGLRIGFAGAAAIAVGFLAGYLAFGRITPNPETAGTQQPVGEILGPRDHELGPPGYTNVRFVDVDPRSGQVELEYNLVRPVRLKANMEDERVQRMLAQAVLNEKNPGAQIQAIKMIDTYVEKPEDEELKRALITVLKTDPTPGVRKHALYVLYKMAFDEDIKDACLHVLVNDNNAGLRIAAINILAQATLEGQVEGKDVFEAVGAQIVADENGYIRNQSDVFKEVNGDVE